MSILGPGGRPVTSRRRVGINVTLITQESGTERAQQHTLAMTLDDLRPERVRVMLNALSNELFGKLHALGMIDQSPPPVAGPNAVPDIEC